MLAEIIKKLACEDVKQSTTAIAFDQLIFQAIRDDNVFKVKGWFALVPVYETVIMSSDYGDVMVQLHRLTESKEFWEKVTEEFMGYYATSIKRGVQFMAETLEMESDEEIENAGQFICDLHEVTMPELAVHHLEHKIGRKITVEMKTE